MDESARSIVTSLAFSDLPLPAEAITDLVEIEPSTLDRSISQLVNFGLLQEFVDPDLPTLYLPPGLLRPWLRQQLDEEAASSIHGKLAAYWRTVFEKKLASQLRIPFLVGLEQCRHHAQRAGDRRSVQVVDAYAGGGSSTATARGPQRNSRFLRFPIT